MQTLSPLRTSCPSARLRFMRGLRACVLLTGRSFSRWRWRAWRRSRFDSRGGCCSEKRVGGGRSAREETDRRMDEQTARGRERKKATQARAKAKPVKYDACRDVGNDAERVFPQLGSRSLGGGLLRRRRRWRCCSKKESFDFDWSQQQRRNSSNCFFCRRPVLSQRHRVMSNLYHLVLKGRTKRRRGRKTCIDNVNNKQFVWIGN